MSHGLTEDGQGRICRNGVPLKVGDVVRAFETPDPVQIVLQITVGYQSERDKARGRLTIDREMELRFPAPTGFVPRADLEIWLYDRSPSGSRWDAVFTFKTDVGYRLARNEWFWSDANWVLDDEEEMWAAIEWMKVLGFVDPEELPALSAPAALPIAGAPC